MKFLFQKNKELFIKFTLPSLILALLLIATHHLKWGVVLGLLGLGFTLIFISITVPGSTKIIGAKRLPIVTRIIGVILLLTAILSLCLGLLNQVVIQKDDTKLLNYNFYYIRKSKMDNILSKQRYSYTYSADKKYISVITLNGFKANVKEYKITDGGTTNITIPKDKDFIISLYANRTVLYTWNIKNSVDSNIAKFIKRSRIDIPTPFSESHKCGTNYDRQNFYFKGLIEGTTNLTMRYEHAEGQNNEYFETNLNITVQ